MANAHWFSSVITAALHAAAYAVLFAASARLRNGAPDECPAAPAWPYFPVTLRACLDRIDICGLSLPSLFGCTLNG